jgi:hypothetical protein
VSYCTNASDPTPTITGLAGGTFGSTAGLSLNASTGAIDISASNPGTYSVTYTTSGTCPNSSNVNVTVNSLANASFNYSAVSYCTNASDPTPTITGLAGGTFGSTAGLSLNASTGTIDVSASNPGTYTVTYTTSGACPSNSDIGITINTSSAATVSQTACDSYTWTLNGTTYTSSGTYTHVGTNAAGCPLTTTLNLTINNSTTASVTQTACDSYTWALNGTTYTNSGTYTHVGTNANGCPLTTTLNLTINNSATATVNETACDSYTWALNGTTYTNSGTYTHVGTNANGCPLTTTLNLTINNSTTATVTETACDSYIWALSGTTYTSSGTYTHVGTNAAGCPLTTTLNLTINNSTTATVNETACDSYTWALNGTAYTSSGTYTHVGTNAAGCTLTTTLNLTINNSTTVTVNETACDSYTWALNGTTYINSGTYTHVGTNAAGCPLTTILNLTINNSTTATVTQTACDSYTWALNGTTYTTSGTYTHVGTNAAGCPLTTTLNLTINTVNVSTTLSGITITANASGASYQWIDCTNGNAIIPGETAQSFTPAANGNYAVIVTNATCSDTSACVPIVTVGIDEQLVSLVKVYPNPTNGQITVEFFDNDVREITMVNAQGQLLQQLNVENYISKIQMELPFENGVYFLEVRSENAQIQLVKMIKN